MTRRPTRRDVVRALVGGSLGVPLGVSLLGCDTRTPRTGVLGAVQRGIGGLEAALGGSVPSVDAPRTPLAAFPSYHLAPTVPVMPDDWALVVSGRVERALSLSLAALRAMARVDVRIRHHSVRGWTAVADWGGVPLAAIAEAAGARRTRYVEFRSFDAPDDVTRGYWSSWDWDSAMHPHTMIAHHMNGAPLTPAHGAPCRLYGSVKLGYKMVKHITEVNFLDVRTGGYWENRGHGWFAGV